MSGTVSSATSSLASELMLNKIMNGQAKTSTGQTITAAGRAMSYNLSNDAYTDRVAKTNMDYGQGLLTAAQSELTSMKTQLTEIRKNLENARSNDSATSTLFKSLGDQAKAVLTEIKTIAGTAKYNNKSLFGAAAINLNAANGVTVDVLGKTLTDVGITGLSAVFGTTIKNKTTAGNAITAIDAAINDIISTEAEYANKLLTLQNRALLLSDQGASLDEASAAQSVASLSGAGNLLSSMLGGTEA